MKEREYCIACVFRIVVKIKIAKNYLTADELKHLKELDKILLVHLNGGSLFETWTNLLKQFREKYMDKFEKIPEQVNLDKMAENRKNQPRELANDHVCKQLEKYKDFEECVANI